MNIAYIDYSLLTKSLDIYVSGCKGSCVGCHNPELHSYEVGIKYNEELLNIKVKSRINKFPDLINKIMIFGGEPLDQDRKEFIKMLIYLNNMSLPIWLFTRYEIDNIPCEIKEMCDYIKTGGYEEANKTFKNKQYGILLASENQKIWKIQVQD